MGNQLATDRTGCTIAARDACVMCTRVPGVEAKIASARSPLHCSPGGDYSFFCSRSGHSDMMKGKLVFG
jgi:azurin